MGQPMVVCCNARAPRIQEIHAAGRPNGVGGRVRIGDLPSTSSGGVVVWVDTIEDLAASFGLESTFEAGGLDHLGVLPTQNPQTGSEAPAHIDPGCGQFHFPRDVGLVRCRTSGLGALNDAGAGGLEIPWLDRHRSRQRLDSYACVQFDDPAHPWGLYLVVEGHGCDAEKAATQSVFLAGEMPALLLQHPDVFRNPCLALYESCNTAMALLAGSLCPPSCEKAIVSVRDGFLYVAWDGASKVVLGRLASKTAPPPLQPLPTTQPPHQPRLPEAAATAVGTDSMGPPIGCLRPAGRRRTNGGEIYQGARNMKQYLNFDGNPPILRAVDLTAASATSSKVLAVAGGGASSDVAVKKLEVRRMRLKQDDVIVVIGTHGLWKWLSPEEAVTVVGQNMHCMAPDAADALAREVCRRKGLGSGDQNESDAEGEEGEDGDILAIVIYLGGMNYVKDYEFARSGGLLGADAFISEGLLLEENPGSGSLGCCTGPGRYRPLACG